MRTCQIQCPNFEYEPLGSRSIRILQLLPGRPSDPLYGYLITTPIDDNAVNYDCLSYMWGDPTPKDSIILSGKALPVAENLANALYHLRHVKEALTIWIDAICINQQDYSERAEQVAMMRQVYQRANLVRIWIYGPTIDASDDAVIALQNYDKASDDPVEGMGPDPAFWDPVIPIFSNSYWNRIWIQQEVVNARQIQLHCMTVVISHQSLLSFQEACVRRLLLTQHSTSATSIPWRAQLSRLIANSAPAAHIAVYKINETIILLSLLNSCKYLNVTDERDRVYGIMHLAKDYQQGNIIPDYTKTVIDVSIDALDHHMTRHQTMDFLCYRHSARDDSFDNDSPTWLPQWLSGREETGRKMQYRFPSMMDTKCPPDSLSADRRCLRLRGMKIDSVRRCVNAGSTGLISSKQFWESSIGLFIQDIAGPRMAELPRAMYDVLSSGYTSDERPSYDATVAGLLAFRNLSENVQHADRELGSFGEHMLDPSGGLDDATKGAIRRMLWSLDERMVILTETQEVGLVPACIVSEGDEIWITLGCPVPVILRPHLGGYRHICTAYIPGLMRSPTIHELKSDAREGDTCGLWTVTDIEVV